MKNKQKLSASIIADVEVFDFLKEKVGERKTRTEAYCDLLDKSQNGFISPFLRRVDYALEPHQCHVTISDLATEWRWHRATVRSFLDALEEMGQLKRVKLAKSVVITMALHEQGEKADNVHEESTLTIRLMEALSNWIVGKTDSVMTGKSCTEIIQQKTGVLFNKEEFLVSGTVLDESASYCEQQNEIREMTMSCIAFAALQKVLRKSRFDDRKPLQDFFQNDCYGQWDNFLELCKNLAELVVTGTDNGVDIDNSQMKKELKSLRSPFLSLLAKSQEVI